MRGNQAFTGGVFSQRIEGGRAGAEIELCDAGVLARTPDGDQFLVAYEQCQIEVGGFSGKMIFCRNADRSITIFCEERSFGQSLARASRGLLAQQLERQSGQQRSARRRGRLIALLLVVGIVGGLMGGLWAIRAGARAAVHALPLSVDQKLGAIAFNSMDLGGPEVHDPTITKALQSIVDRLAPHTGMDAVEFRVHVVKSPISNAFALPGGIIVVYTGLVTSADDAGQVAGVLGHEMAHVTQRHGLERVADSANLLIVLQLLLGDVQGLLALGAEIFTVASVNSYSRTQELEADAEGTDLLHKAAIDPEGLARFLESVEADEGELPAAAAWLSTHPQHKLRIAAIRARVAKLPPQQFQPLDLDWAQVQQAAAQ